MKSFTLSLIACGLGIGLSGCGGSSSPSVEEDIATQAPEVETLVSNMIAELCPGNTCSGSGASSYWQVKDDGSTKRWDIYGIEKTVTFSSSGCTVSDVNGDSDLTFEAGVPVTLTLKNTDTTNHTFSAAALFNSVAWRKAESTNAEYKAAYFNSFELKAASESETIAKLFFIPMASGSYAAMCDNTGISLSVDFDRGLTVDQERSSERVDALNSDPRRDSAHQLWANVDTTYYDNPIYLADDFYFEHDGYPISSLTMKADTAYKVKLQNKALESAANSKHYLTSPAFFSSTVFSKAEDSDVIVKAPYLYAVELLKGNNKYSDVYVVPTASGEFYAYCQIGDHAEHGMQFDFIVTE